MAKIDKFQKILTVEFCINTIVTNIPCVKLSVSIIGIFPRF